MLVSFYRKLCGADKWPIATATVTSTEQVSSGGRGGRTMKVYFKYVSAAGPQDGKFLVDDNSSLYGLAQGEKFDVHFNPRNPSSYYCPEASSLSETIRESIAIFMTLFTVTVFLIEYFGR